MPHNERIIPCMQTVLGLRIDVDTYRGTSVGVPNLCRLLSNNDMVGTFFFSVGPDNMGRNLWRLFRPAFLKKMIRSNAPGLYGWDILLRGTAWPGPVIGRKLAPVIAAAARGGHEIGLHAWDHYKWQSNVDRMNAQAVLVHLQKAFDMISTITGNPPVSSACPAWKCNDTVLEVKENFPFKYNSDCRGESIFLPIVNGRELKQPQIPTTLPTYDEVIGGADISDATYNKYILSLIKPGEINVLTIHAEVEGISRLGLFKEFIRSTLLKKIKVVALGELLNNDFPIVKSSVVMDEIPGRDGWIARQHQAS